MGTLETLLWTIGPPFLLLNGVLIFVTYLTLLERKFAARLQSRVGPYEVGRPHGWLQPIADGLKLLLKEDIVPTPADRTVYNLAPIVFLVPAFLMYAAMPFAQGWALADLEIGLVFVLVGARRLIDHRQGVRRLLDAAPPSPGPTVRFGMSGLAGFSVRVSY